MAISSTQDPHTCWCLSCAIQGKNAEATCLVLCHVTVTTSIFIQEAPYGSLQNHLWKKKTFEIGFERW
jgi:hypothetical protein